MTTLATRLRTLATRSEAVAAQIHPDLTEERAMVLQDAADMNEAANAVEWRPIETAPRDGTYVLVCCTHGQYVAGWHDQDGEQSQYAYWHVDDNKHGPFGLRGSEPTHWMPLPPPPVTP